MASPPERGEPLRFLSPGHSPDLLRKLRRGHWPVQDQLDLHGLSRRDAAALVGEFIGEAAGAGLRCVRIVHGKGFGSPNREPVLREKVREWLPLREEVLAFVEAPAAEGGSGAVLVLLKGR